ncbi:MAG: hypothetical protein AAF693_10495 [Bacteroidota bacterium]
MKRIFMLAFGIVLIASCSEYEATEPDKAVDLNRAKAIWIDTQSKNGGGNNGRVVDQLTPLFERYSQHLAHNDLPFLKIPVATQNKVVHHMEGVDTDLELGTYLLYVDNQDGENLYLVNVVLGEGNNFNNGLVTVHDLAGQYIVGYRFQDGEYLLVSEERETTQNGRTSGVECWYVDHYTCTVRIGPDDCELDYTTVHCEYYTDKPPLIFGDGSGEGGGSGEGSSLTDPVQCDDGYFADEQGRCINACGPGMVYDETEGCIDEAELWDLDQTFGSLCSNINFIHTAKSFKAEISGLGGTYFNRALKRSINVELGVNCIDLPEYYFGTRYDAAEGFASIFNQARTRIEHELEIGDLSPTTLAVRSRLISLLKTWLNTNYPGATFSTNTCSGDIPNSTADYGC